MEVSEADTHTVGFRPSRMWGDLLPTRFKNEGGNWEAAAQLGEERREVRLQQDAGSTRETPGSHRQAV